MQKDNRMMNKINIYMSIQSKFSFLGLSCFFFSLDFVGKTILEVFVVLEELQEVVLGEFGFHNVFGLASGINVDNRVGFVVDLDVVGEVV